MKQKIIIFASLLLIGFAICFLMGSCNVDELEFIPVNLEPRIDSIGQEYIDQGKTGAISIAVMRNDSLLYNNAFGFAHLEEKIPVTKNHYFNMASVSKLVGSVIVMKLVEEEKLDLDQTLQELLPEYPRAGDAQRITLRHLLTHTSGILDYAIEIDTVFMKTGIPPTRKDYTEFFATHELLFEPGEWYAYSNSGFKLMEFIIERATGNQFAHEIERVICQPTGLDIKLLAERASNPLMTEALDFTDTTLNKESYWTWISGDGGMTATSGDLAKFAQKWSDGTIIPEASFETMTTPYQLSSGIATGYGLGTRTGTFEGELAVGHTGGNKTTMAMMMYFPEKDISIAVFDNTDGSPTSAMDIMGSVALAVLGKKEPNYKNVKISKADSLSYVGVYDMYDYVERGPDRISVYFNPEDQHYYRKYAGAVSKGQKLVALGDDLFAVDPYMKDRVEFVRNSFGEVVAFRNYWNGLFQRMGFKRPPNF